MSTIEIICWVCVAVTWILLIVLHVRGTRRYKKFVDDEVLEEEHKALERKDKSRRIDELYNRLGNPDFTAEEMAEFCHLCLEKEIVENKKMFNTLLKCGFMPKEIPGLAENLLDKDKEK